MYLKNFLAASFIGTSIALVQVYCQNASALTAPEVGKIAKQITVRIEWQAGGRNKQGSGFLIKKEDNTYYVLTAYHVVAAEAQYTLIAPDGNRYPLDRRKISHKEGTDLAVVQFTSNKNYQVAKTGNSDSAIEGSTVYVAGFPAATSAVTSSLLYRFLEGKVSANASQPLAEGYSLVYSNPTLGGMSGGPVLNEQGEVIAIHGKAETQAQASGDGIKVASTGSNLGIAVNTFHRLALLDTGVSPPQPETRQVPKADDFYLKGLDLERKKDYAGAIKEYERALAINPQYTEAYFARGYARGELKEYQGAIADYNQTIAFNPKFVNAYYNRGVMRGELKEYQGAIADYNQTIALDPNYVNAYYNRGVARGELKERPDAIADYNKTIALDPNYVNAYYNRGVMRGELKEYPDAIADYSKTIALDPKYVNAYLNRGVARGELKDYPAAIADYNRVIALDPKYALAYYNRGVAWGELKNYKEAISNYDRAIALDPKYANSYYNRGVIRGELNQYDAAIADYTKTIAIDPKYTNAYLNRGFNYYEVQQTEAAIASWRQTIKLNSSLPAPRLALGVALYSKGKVNEGLQIWNEGVALLGTKPDLQLLKTARWQKFLLQDAAKLLADPRSQN